MTTYYEHYGTTIRFSITYDFRQDLVGNGIGFHQIPVLDVDVIRYTTSGSPLYACIKKIEEGEMVYITTAIPEDLDFALLIKDVDNQRLYNAEPMKMKTKLKKMIDLSTDFLITTNKKPNEENFFSLPVEPNIKDVAFQVYRDFGYSKRDIMWMENYDIDPDYRNEFLKYYNY